MPFKLNPITGNLDLVNPSVTGSGVIGPSSSTDKAIARWNGTGGNLLSDSKTQVQDGGAVEAQSFITRRTVDVLVTVRSGYSWIAPSVEMASGGVVILESNAQLIII
jgi:hypothetical protein